MELNILFASNDNYAKLMGVSILSIMANNKNGDSINIFILDDTISGENKARLYAIGKKYGCSITFFNIQDKLSYFLDNKTALWMGNAAALGRFYFTDFLPDTLQRVLYLDCDTLINGPLDDLFKMDMLNKTAAMGYDCIRNEFKKSVGIDENAPYFNSGVLLIDVERWKKNDYKNKLIKYLQNNKDSKLPDQNALNIVLKDDIVPLDIRYNFQSQFFLYSYRNTLAVYNLKEHYWYKEDVFNDGKEHVCIYHFSGNTFVRPWFKNSRHPVKALYDNYYYNSPWAEEGQRDYKMSLHHRIQYALFKHGQDLISVIIAGLMQRIFVFFRFKV